jgi:acetylornithine deacetylase/succinyl-diaminopimelate desuccinylase-like protein
MNDDVLTRALAEIDRDRVAELCMAIVDVPSPTCGERPLAELIAADLGAAGIAAHVQPIDDEQANAWAVLGAPGEGPDVLLYAPIDTLTVGDAAEDVPWLAESLPDHALPSARRVGERIVGLGAHNPKGHAACIVAALEAVQRAEVPLTGRLLAGFGAGGMPTNARDGKRRNTGQGVGASFLLEQGVWADAAIIAKSGWAVSWEEVGLAWIDVTVAGIHTYVGARHRLPYRNPIVDAGRVAAHLEEWFPTYAANHAGELVEPQGIVGAARAGWWRMAAVVPAVAKLRVDLRLVPGQSPLDALRELDAALDPLRHGDDAIAVRAELALSIPGSRTPPDHWICRAAIAAWEHVAGSAHQPATATSGATDANILRNRGIPTVRIGLPKATDDGVELDFAAGMNTVDIDALDLLTRHLVTTVVDVGTRSRKDLETSP